MSYKFDDSEKFRANVYLLVGVACFGPVGTILNDYIVNENTPSDIDSLIALFLVVVGFLTVARAYSIMYEKDLWNE